MTSTPEGHESPWTQPSQPGGTGYGTGSAWGPAPQAPGYQAPPPAPATAPVPPPPAGQGAPAAVPPVGYAALREALRPGVVPLRPLTLGEVLDGAFRSVRHNPGVMFALTAVVMTLSVAVQTVLQWYVQGLLAGSFAEALADLEGDTEFLTGSLAASTAQFVTATPVLGAAVAILTGLLIVSVSRSVIGQRASAAEIWEKVRPRAWALVGFSILLNLAVALAALLVTSLVALFASWQRPGLAVLAALVGLLGVLVLTVWLSVRTFLVPPVMVLEGQTLRRALPRAWRLTRGSFWRLLGVLALAFVILVVVSSVVAVPGAVITSILFPFASPTALGPLLTNAVVSLVAETISTVFLAAVVALLYIDVRMRREGLDVALARAAAGTP